MYIYICYNTLSNHHYLCMIHNHISWHNTYTYTCTPELGGHSHLAPPFEKKHTYLHNPHPVVPDQGDPQLSDEPVLYKHVTDMKSFPSHLNMIYHHSASPVAFWKTKSFPLRFMIPSFKWNFHLFLFLFICWNKINTIYAIQIDD